MTIRNAYLSGQKAALQKFAGVGDAMGANIMKALGAVEQASLAKRLAGGAALGGGAGYLEGHLRGDEDPWKRALISSGFGAGLGAVMGPMGRHAVTHPLTGGLA